MHVTVVEKNTKPQYFLALSLSLAAHEHQSGYQAYASNTHHDVSLVLFALVLRADFQIADLNVAATVFHFGESINAKCDT